MQHDNRQGNFPLLPIAGGKITALTTVSNGDEKTATFAEFRTISTYLHQTGPHARIILRRLKLPGAWNFATADGTGHFMIRGRPLTICWYLLVA